jgi:hypothetical protein
MHAQARMRVYARFSLSGDGKSLLQHYYEEEKGLGTQL